jgi:aminopeptidase N
MNKSFEKLKSQTVYIADISTLFTLLAIFFISCTANRLNDANSSSISTDDALNIQNESTKIAETENWYIPDGEIKELRPLEWDLVHQKIWVRFNFAEKQVIGRTELFFINQTINNQILTLDSKTTQIKSLVNLSNGKALEFQKDSATVHIKLDKAYNLSDSLFIAVEFVSTPPNRGLYFVNPTGNKPNIPTQVWTLGQPEDNSFWLPTIDHPAERTTQETWISVPDNFKTVSNGVFVEGKTLPGDSLRTDYWVMDKPHAPYLIALAVGEYDITEQLVDGVILKYYTEPEFTPYVESIYAKTDDMLKFFNSKFDIQYPWLTYAQVPVRDFIASGMENTTLTILFNNVQITDRQAVDVEFQDLIAHELIHHWFGNLVTCKDWANLPLNEGFARYFETIYRRYSNGDVSAEWNSATDRERYFKEAQIFRRPLIFYRYTEPEDMYDRHTYEKAGLILRMLHRKVGDRLWWSSLNRYLNDNAYKAVDWTNLRDAFAAETRQNMDSFFEKWFTGVGHPELKINYVYSNEYPAVNIQQVQNPERSTIFEFPIDIYYTDDLNREFVKNVYISSVDTTIYLPVTMREFGEMIVDPYRIVVAEYEESLTTNDIVSRLAHPSVHIRHEALKKINNLAPHNPFLMNELYEFYHFEHHGPLRNMALYIMGSNISTDWNAFIHSIDSKTEDYYIARMTAASISAKLNGVDRNQYLEHLKSDPSYYVEQYTVNLLRQQINDK